MNKYIDFWRPRRMPRGEDPGIAFSYVDEWEYSPKGGRLTLKNPLETERADESYLLLRIS